MEPLQSETDNFQYKYDTLLRFLSKKGQQGYIFAMADDQRYIAQINTSLTKDLKARGIETELLFLNPESDEPLFYQIKQAAAEKNSLIVANLYTLIRANGKGTDLLVELNYARESLWELGIPILFWTDIHSINLIANHAPDLFSQRRMGTVYFTDIMDSHVELQISGHDRDAYISTEHFKQLQEETQLFEKRLEAAKNTNYPPARVAEEIALPLAYNYAQMGLKIKAIHIINEYIPILKQLENDGIIEKMAKIFDLVGDYANAINILDTRITYLKSQLKESQINERILKSLAYLNNIIGEIYFKSGISHKFQYHFQESNLFYNELYHHTPSNPDYKNNLAISFERLGNTSQSTGDINKTLYFFEKYNTLMQELYSEFPFNTEYKFNLAISFSKLGDTYVATGDLNRALWYFETYNSFLEELYNEFPNNLDYKYFLAITYERLSETYVQTGYINKALEFCEKFKNIFIDLNNDYPLNVDYKNGLAISYSKMGEIYASTSDFNEALMYFEMYNSLVLNLFNEFPLNVDYKRGLAISYERLGNTFLAMGEFNKALEFFEKYSSLRLLLNNEFPSNVDHKNGLAISYLRLGSVYKAQNNKKIALNYYLKAQQLCMELVEKAPGFVGYMDNLEFINNLIKELSV